MSRPVRFNIKGKDTKDWGINTVQMPEGHMGEGFFATSLDKVVGLARKNSIWPLPSGNGAMCQFSVLVGS